MFIAILIIVILAIPFIIALFGSTEFCIIRTIVIHRGPHEVFEYIRFLKNGEKYNKWVMTDPSMRKDFRGEDGTVGFVYAWDSKNNQVGKGEQEIIQLTPDERVAHEVRFEKPFASTSQMFMTTHPVGNGDTQLTWGFVGQLNYMMRVMHLVLNLRKALTNDIDTSLNQLKTILENT